MINVSGKEFVPTG